MKHNRPTAIQTTMGDLSSLLSGVTNNLNTYRGWTISRQRFGWEAQGPGGAGKIGANSLPALKSEIDNELCGWRAHDYHMEEAALEYDEADDE